MGEDRLRYDIAVIGAGVNGAGIARDAAMRGLRVAVLDQDDLCNATSAISSRLIHGGLRYLEYGEVPLVYESLHERRYLRRIAGHLVEPLRINIPIFEGAKRGPLIIRLGMIAYDVLSWNKALPRHDMLGRKAVMELEPGLKSDGLRAAARYFDAQVQYAERLVLENLLAARAAGADILTHRKVTKIIVDNNAVAGLEWTDSLTGETATIETAVIVNSAGPWVDDVLATTGRSFEPYIGGTKGSHIIVSAFEGAPRDAFYVEAKSDGRPFFIIPWNDLYLIGTTDLRYDGDLANVRASREEVDYLIAETNRVFPGAGLSVGDVHYAYAGVRPLPRRSKGPESAITRKHIIKAHRRDIRGLFSIIGGKLTTYRHLAKQTVDQAGKALGRRLPECRTHDTPLPGAHGIEEARQALADIEPLTSKGIERLLKIYGGRAAGIATLAAERPDLAACIDEAATVPAAEVAYVIREEFPRTLIDIVHRRMMIGLDADQGRPSYAQIAELAAAEFGWDEDRKTDELEKLLAYSDSLRIA